MIGDMSGGMRGHLDHARGHIAEANDIALTHRPIDAGYLCFFGPWTCHRRAGRGLDLEIAAGVIGMPMGVPDIADRPAAPSPASATIGRASCRERVCPYV